ncbi:hypothetical protein SRABI02_01538 [Plantibacter cousiniae]|nr:hypothetical protein SRABI02_01538 [Plantibacter cousiniae]
MRRRRRRGRRTRRRGSGRHPRQGPGGCRLARGERSGCLPEEVRDQAEGVLREALRQLRAGGRRSQRGEGEVHLVLARHRALRRHRAPEGAVRLQLVGERGERERLDEVLDDPRRDRRSDDPEITGRGDGDDVDVDTRRPDASAELETVRVRQVEVEQDEVDPVVGGAVGRSCPQRLHRGGRIARHRGEFEALDAAQVGRVGLLGDRFVLDDQDPDALAHVPASSRTPTAAGSVTTNAEDGSRTTSIVPPSRVTACWTSSRPNPRP